MKAIGFVLFVVVIAAKVDTSEAFWGKIFKAVSNVVSNVVDFATCSLRCDHGGCHVAGFLGNCKCSTGWKDKWCNNDINECSDGSDTCSQLCSNYAGGYSCYCNAGYMATGHFCSNKDECYTGTDQCAETCHDNEGSYTCSCGSGKTLASDQRACNDINECKSNNGGCAHGCDNNYGSYQCKCNVGYGLNSDQRSCNNKNECDLNTDNCAHICNDNVGSFTCACHSGYTLNSNGHSCDNINECTAGTHDCSQVCVDTSGSYTCACDAGYGLGDDLRTCEDHNECELSTHDCSQICKNHEGRFSCDCNAGYTLNAADGKSCDDIDECASENHCSQICSNTVGSFTCSCNRGFTADEERCHDVNECETSNGGCDQICSNLVGSHSCSCNAGYQLASDNKMCHDVDECAMDSDECDQDCTNTVGSYTCSCTVGYTSSGFRCLDIDECVTEEPCGHMCMNSAGSYSCECESGFLLDSDGRTCQPVCEVACQNGGSCMAPNTCNCTEDFGGEHCKIPLCDPVCVHGTCTKGDIANECVCSSGYEGVSCETDIDECQLTHGCEHVCTNSEGSYDCSCNDGYALVEDGHSCIDVNECEGEHGCGHDCNNNIGSFECSCREGWLLAVDGFTCEDVNECDGPSHGCEQLCINGEGSYQCTCEEMFYLGTDGKSCYELVDEWTLSRSTCQCYYDKTRTDCPCCIPGGCQCDQRSPSRCVQCGYGDTCGISIDEIAAPCRFNNSKLGKLAAKLAAKCDGRGRYEPRQCDESGACWCVGRMGHKITGSDGAETCENPYWLNGWTLSRKTCQCDHDPTSFKCACCRINGCQCRSGDSCVQCGLTYTCKQMKSYNKLFKFGIPAFSAKTRVFDEV